MAGSKLSIATSLLLSLNGLIVVFSVLVILSLATIVIARVIGATEKGEAKQTPASSAPAQPTPPVEEDLGDVVAVLQGALSMETGIPVDQLEIVSIRSVSDTTT